LQFGEDSFSGSKNIMLAYFQQSSSAWSSKEVHCTPHNSSVEKNRASKE
jgi:hypothetical protein